MTTTPLYRPESLLSCPTSSAWPHQVQHCAGGGIVIFPECLYSAHLHQVLSGESGEKWKHRVPRVSPEECLKQPEVQVDTEFRESFLHVAGEQRGHWAEGWEEGETMTGTAGWTASAWSVQPGFVTVMFPSFIISSSGWLQYPQALLYQTYYLLQTLTWLAARTEWSKIHWQLL